MLGETAKLAVNLTFGTNAGTVLGKTTQQLKGMDSQISKTTKGMGAISKGATTLGAGIGTAIRNGAILAAAGITALTGLVALSVKEGQEALKVDKLLANAVRSSNLKTLKGAGKVNAADYRGLIAQQQTLLQLTGKDDELIAQVQTRLIQMRATGKEALALTPLIVAAATATGKPVETVSMAVGKAIQGNAAALGRIGIVLPKLTAEQVKAIKSSKTLTAAQKEAALGGTAYDQVLKELTKRFGNVNAALSGAPEVRLAVLREGLANIREEAGIKLLPALTRIVDVVGKALVPAFGKFVDRILPDISKGIDTFASALEGGGAERAINGIADSLGSMIDLLKIAAGPVKAIVSAFLSLPTQVQGILVGGFAINKLSGGLIGQGLGQIAGGLIQRGGTPANPLFVSDVTGGLGGGGGLASGTKGLGVAGAVAAGAAAATVLAVGGVALDQYQQNSDRSNALAVKAAEFAKTATLEQLKAGREAVIAGAKELAGQTAWNPEAASAFEGLNKTMDVLTAAIKAREAAPGTAIGGRQGPPSPANAAALAAQAAIRARAVEHGKTPTESAIAATFALNTKAVATGNYDLRPKGGGLVSKADAGSAAVMERAVAKGFHPTASGITATLAKNAAKAAASTRAASMLAQMTAIRGVSAYIAGSAAIVAAVRSIAAPVVNVTTNVSIRDMQLKSGTYSSYGRVAAFGKATGKVGAQKL